MQNYITKTLMLTLLTLWIGIFGVSPCYALTLNEAQKLLANDGAGSGNFGNSVSLSGDTAVIGAWHDDDNGTNSGSAYVLIRDGAGMWREQQKLLASDGDAGDEFGFQVSLSGDTAVIGAIRNDDNGSSSGSAYVFVRDGGVWSEQQKLNASDAAAGDFFGFTVSLSGDTAMVGAIHNRNSNNDVRSGSVYVFIHDGAGVWREQQKLTASDSAEGDEFGRFISLFRDTAVIGVLRDDDNGTNSGSAYVFVRDGTGIWSVQQKLNTRDGAPNDSFGEEVSLSGDTAVIGAPFDDDNGSSSGSAYVFLRDGTGIWSEQQKLNPSDGAAGDQFGDSVSIAGNMAVIGAKVDDDNGSSSGSAYVFVRDSTGVWSEQQKLNPSDGKGGDQFGNSVSISGDTVVIGAVNSGSAYVFEASDPNNDLLTLEKLINHRVRETAGTAAQLLAATRYRVDYKVTNNRPNRVYRVQVFENGELVCNLYALDPGESTQMCASNQIVLVGINNVPATVTAIVSGSNHKLDSQTNAYYNGLTNMPGKLIVTHYVNDNNANTQANTVDVNSNQAEVLFRVENTGSIEIYRIKTYHDPSSPINSGWQQQCIIGTLLPGEVRYCKRTISVTQAGLNKAFGRAQGTNANFSATSFVNAANPSYFNVVLP